MFSTFCVTPVRIRVHIQNIKSLALEMCLLWKFAYTAEKMMRVCKLVFLNTSTRSQCVFRAWKWQAPLELGEPQSHWAIHHELMDHVNSKLFELEGINAHFLILLDKTNKFTHNSINSRSLWTEIVANHESCIQNLLLTLINYELWNSKWINMKLKIMIFFT